MHPSNRTPVLVGIGTATRHEEDFTRALEPMDLMLEAVRAAGADTGSASALALGRVEYISVPRGRWKYANPAGEIARAIGARATTVLSTPGVLQQALIGEACARIARGEIGAALVAGSDAGYRLLRAQIAGQKAGERVQDDGPDIFLQPKEELRHAAEKRAGLVMPVALYAILESAYRAKHGWTVSAHRDRLAELYSGLSRVAAQNPHAWNRNAIPAEVIRDASDKNPMQAFPYTRFHCSTWNVDQAAALLFCSASLADELGIPRDKWIFPLASTESNHMVAVSARADLASCPGARITGVAALDAGALGIDQVDLVELYSCFPVAIETYAEALGIPLSLTRPPTVTGGMAFAGGPYNNYFLQATCRAAELLRQGAGRNALLSCVSGVITKQAFGLWSRDAPPGGFVHLDLSDQVARETEARDVLEEFTGVARVAGYTILHGRGQLPKGIALVDTSDGKRALVTTGDRALIASMQETELVGVQVRVAANTLTAIG